MNTMTPGDGKTIGNHKRPGESPEDRESGSLFLYKRYPKIFFQKMLTFAAILPGAAYQIVSRVKHRDRKKLRMTPTGQEDRTMSNMKEMENEKLSLNELEQTSGGMLLAGLLIGALVTGTVALFGVAALSDEQNNA